VGEIKRWSPYWVCLFAKSSDKFLQGIVFELQFLHTGHFIENPKIGVALHILLCECQSSRVRVFVVDFPLEVLDPVGVHPGGLELRIMVFPEAVG